LIKKKYFFYGVVKNDVRIMVFVCLNVLQYAMFFLLIYIACSDIHIKCYGGHESFVKNIKNAGGGGQLKKKKILLKNNHVFKLKFNLP